MNGLHYILAEDGKTPVVVPLMVWAQWFEKSDSRLIAQNMLDDDGMVSTVFLGLDHRFSAFDHQQPPILWETMVFGPPKMENLFCRMREVRPVREQRRYSSHEEAMKGHAELLRQYRKQEEQQCSETNGNSSTPQGN